MANRQTMVRVYPWGDAWPDASSRFCAAQLYATIGATTLGPLTSPGEVALDRTLAEMRSDTVHSFDFVLPDEWTSLSASEPSKFVHLRAVINPSGTDECAGCTSDNEAFLNFVQFRHVGLNNHWAMKFRPFLVTQLTAPGDSVLSPPPTLDMLATTVESFHTLLPVADGLRGIRLYPWRYVTWRGPTTVGERDIFEETMISTYLPTGTLSGNPPNDYYGFLWGGPGCLGHAYYRTPYLIANACDGPGHVAAHELTHAVGQLHAGNGHGEDCCGGHDPLYPGDHGQMESDGVGMRVSDRTALPDVESTSVFGPEREDARHDYMSYGGGFRWISHYVWHRVIAFLNTADPAPVRATVTAAAAGSPAVRMRVGGHLGAGGEMTLSPLFSALAGDPVSGNGPNELRFRDANAGLVASHSLRLWRAQDIAPPSADLFAETVDVPQEWRTLELYDGVNVTQTWSRSINPPQVELLAPQPGFQWGGQGSESVQWSAGDGDQDALTWRVLGTPDQGQTYHVLAAGTEGTSVPIDLTAVPGSGAWQILVELSDGFDATRSSPAAGSIAPKAPQPLIVSPADGWRQVASEPTHLMGVAADWEDDAASDAMIWRLDDQPVGTGSHVQLQGLGLGQHTLELVASNFHNLQGSMSIQFEVVDGLPAPAPVSPPNGAAGQQAPVALQWTAVSGATSYRVQACLHPTFDVDVLEGISLAAAEHSFKRAQPGRTYYWRVRGEQGETASNWSPVYAFSTQQPATGVELPARLSSRLIARPNPFNPRTTLEFTLPGDASVELVVFDVGGRRVRTLVEGPLAKGMHEIGWDGLDDRRRRVGSGVYIVRLRAGDLYRSVRVGLLK